MDKERIRELQQYQVGTPDFADKFEKFPIETKVENPYPKCYVCEEFNPVYKYLSENRSICVKCAISPRAQQYIRQEPKIGRNEICHCGSGKKYKNCCL